MVKGNDFPIGVVNSYSREQLIEFVTVLGILPADKASDLTRGELIDVVTKYNLEQKSKESKATKSTKTSKKTEDKESKPSSKGSKSSKTTKSTKTTKAKSTEASEETDASLSETKQTKTSTKKTSKKASKSDKAEETTDKSADKASEDSNSSDKSKKIKDIVVQELPVAEQDVESANVVSTDVASETTSDKPAKKSKSTKSPKSSKATKSKKEDKDAKDKTEQIGIEQLDNIEKTEDTNTSVKEENVENNKSSKSNKKSSSKKTKKTSKKDVEETSVSVSEEKEEIKIETTEDDKETASTSTPVSPKKAQKNKNNGRSAKRSFTFGPDTSATENSANLVETTSENSSNENNEAEGEDVPTVPAEPVVTMIEAEGVLSIPSSDKGDGNGNGNGNGFLHKTNYLPGEGDVYVGQNIIRRNGLRRGDYVKCLVVDNKNPKEKYAPLKKILEVNGIPYDEETTPELLKKRPRFERLTAIYPDEKLSLETPYNPNKKRDFSTRIIDLFSPIGKGQRGMIVSPPKAGKTVLLKKVANAITTNNPKCKLIVLLIDERPEEVTDMQRSITGEVVYSTFDKKPENHVRVTELVLERAMRMVELGEDVVILLDSMTRLARAYNLTINPTGRTLSGGLDPGSLYGPKRFFGAARNIEGGGSLTIIATALVETGSKMDEVIFEEFKGTGNMEIVLDRKLADRRVFPAIAVDKSGTRREDLLLTDEEREAIWLLRKRIADVDTVAATEAVLNFMEKTMTNASFVASIRKSFSAD